MQPTRLRGPAIQMMNQHDPPHWPSAQGSAMNRVMVNSDRKEVNQTHSAKLMPGEFCHGF
jgi:hypothetical protein